MTEKDDIIDEVVFTLQQLRGINRLAAFALLNSTSDDENFLDIVASAMAVSEISAARLEETMEKLEDLALAMGRAKGGAA